jgi:hypothetical protein
MYVQIQLNSTYLEHVSTLRRDIVNHVSLRLKHVELWNIVSSDYWNFIYSTIFRHGYIYKLYNFVAFGARKSIAAPTTSRRAVPSLARSIQSSSERPTSWRSFLTLSAHLVLGLPTCRFPCKLLTNTLYTVLTSVMRATCPAQHSLRLFITLNISGAAYRLCNSSLCSPLHSPVSSSLFGPYILLNNLFSNTLNQFSYSWVRVHVSHP